MTATRSQPPGWWWVALVAACGAVVAGWPSLVGPAIAIPVAIIVWQWPGAAELSAVVGILVVRPALDVFGTRSFGWSAWLPSPSAVFGLGLLLVSAVLALRRLHAGLRLWPNRHLWRTHSLLLATYVLAAAAGASHYGAVGVANGVRELLRVCSVVGGFLVLLWWVEENPGRRSIGWGLLVVGLLSPTVVAAVQYFRGNGNLWTAGLNRLQGTFSDPNTLGPYLVPFILWAVADLRGRGAAAKAARLAGAAILTAELLATYSRTAVFVLVAGLGALALLRLVRFGRRELTAGLGTLVVLSAIGWWLAGGAIERRFAGIRIDKAALEEAQAGASENSFTWRLINWSILIAMSREHLAFGHGAGMTTQLNPLVSDINGLPYNAHDDYVRMLFEGGAVGLLAYLAYVIMLCTWTVRTAHQAPASLSSAAYAVAAGWLAIALLTAGTPEVSLQTVTLYELYGMTALVGLPGWSADRDTRPPAQALGPERAAPA